MGTNSIYLIPFSNIVFVWLVCVLICSALYDYNKIIMFVFLEVFKFIVAYYWNKGWMKSSRRGAEVVKMEWRI